MVSKKLLFVIMVLTLQCRRCINSISKVRILLFLVLLKVSIPYVRSLNSFNFFTSNFKEYLSFLNYIVEDDLFRYFR